ncbi:sugar 3,4-ketoisomerase [Dethiosulfovibrio salsuginis]|uniref:WxcM-like, C-terminal n=1 Tax=Dethiosulfovibrio salsuginis TaxID=561720 RepID=A0A1X7LE51_9BACT|nr:FdtA/QdtA family cupin domain-containing protein [Dethiosulfovibrio salsuginis]SMG51784.1 WxcM-like, C-terminal [Dethiosulfovibrio salsuginis]
MKIYSAQTIKNPADSDDLLCVWETGKQIPFDVKRIYHIGNVKAGTVRGHHAHKKLEQILLCPYGSIEVALDDGTEVKNCLLDSPDKGLYVGPGVWHTMKWIESGSLLLVMASNFYVEEDYIRNYGKFKEKFPGETS